MRSRVVAGAGVRMRTTVLLLDGPTGALADELDDPVSREDRADGQLPAHGVSLAQVQGSLPRPLASPGLEPVREIPDDARGAGGVGRRAGRGGRVKRIGRSAVDRTCPS